MNAVNLNEDYNSPFCMLAPITINNSNVLGVKNYKGKGLYYVNKKNIKRS